MNLGNLKGSKLVLVGGLLVSAFILIGLVVLFFGGKGPTQLGVTTASSSTTTSTTTISSSSSLQFPPPPPQQQTSPSSSSSITTSSSSSTSDQCHCVVTPEFPLGVLTIVVAVLGSLFLFAFVKARGTRKRETTTG